MAALGGQLRQKEGLGGIGHTLVEGVYAASASVVVASLRINGEIMQALGQALCHDAGVLNATTVDDNAALLVALFVCRVGDKPIVKEVNKKRLTLQDMPTAVQGAIVDVLPRTRFCHETNARDIERPQLHENVECLLRDGGGKEQMAA